MENTDPKVLTGLGQLDESFARSHEAPVLIFKHSETCSISHAMHRYVTGTRVPVSLVVVQRSRVVSDELAKRTGIRHESPQLLRIENGECTAHASHFDIESMDLENFDSQ